MIDSAAVALTVGFSLSVTFTVNVDVPGVPSGVPEITPPFKVSPAGSEPSPGTSDHVYGPVPPDGSSVCE